MIHTVPLSQSPADFQPPDALRDRFWYENDREQLCFDGFMSKATYDRLKPLSHDTNYQRAIDELFRVCVPEDQEHTETKIGVMVSVLIGLAALSALALFAMIR